MKIVWALFDDANSCYQAALKDLKDYEVYSIGINDLTMKNYFKIDLRITNDKLISQLEQLPKPNIIIASPPCESWSVADNQARMTKDVWDIRNKNFYDEWNKKPTANGKRFFHKQDKTRLIGEDTISATIFIIKHFEPSFWVIENPKSSLIWKFQEQHHNFYGFLNKTNYGAYDDTYSLKPTIFKSNIKMDLKNHYVKLDKKMQTMGNYNARSNIPKALILEIFQNLEREHICKYQNK